MSSLRGSLQEAKDIKVPEIDQQAKTLSSYLVSYEFAVKQRVALSNHLESLRDKRLISLLKKELKRAQELEDKIFNDIKKYVKAKPEPKRRLPEVAYYLWGRGKNGYRPTYSI
jgi:hypothetical protein